jgi:hypothetical protein
MLMLVVLKKTFLNEQTMHPWIVNLKFEMQSMIYFYCSIVYCLLVLLSRNYHYAKMKAFHRMLLQFVETIDSFVLG